MKQKDPQDEVPGLNNLEMLAGKGIPFTVPEGYFSALEQQLRSQVSIQQGFEETEHVFTIPQGYFDELPERMESAIFAADLREKTTESCFDVPSGYFDTLADRIAVTVSEPVIRPIQSKRLYAWIPYAAAACVTLAVTVSLLVNRQDASLDDQFSQIPEQEIIQYLQANSDAGDVEVIKENVGAAGFEDGDIPTQEIEAYLNGTL